MTTDTDLCTFWYTSGVHSFDDLKTKEVLIGAAGTGSQGYSFPHAIDYALHTQMKIIPGYKGTGDRILAMQQGEIQGGCGMNASTVTSIYPQLLAAGQLVPIMQTGLHPYSALPNVPLTLSFATTDDERRILTSISSEMDIARIFAAPPELRRTASRFYAKPSLQAMSDPDLIDEAKKMRLDLNPMSGEEVAKIVAGMSDISAEFKAELRAAMGS